MGLKKLWNSTVFPDKIAAWKERKAQKKAYEKEEEECRQKMRHEARLEAMGQAKDKLKEKMVEEEVKNIIEGKQNKFTKVLKNIGNDLANSGFKMPDSNKMRDVWGAGEKQPKGNVQSGLNSLPTQDKIASMMGGNNRQQNNPINANLQTDNSKRFESDRIKNLIGGQSNFNIQKHLDKKVVKKKKVKKTVTKRKTKRYTT